MPQESKRFYVSEGTRRLRMRRAVRAMRKMSEAALVSARSTEQLARCFQAFFRPVVDDDDDDQVSYVFN
jgi:hypothetical protein